MNELRAILEAADSHEGKSYLATVVDVDGSAYRRPGARMLIREGGDRVGMISGGCLERDLCRDAASICRNGPKLVSFDTRTESTNFNARYNLGCNGIIYILVEPVTRDENCPLRFVREVVDLGSPKMIATVYQSEGFESFHIGDRFSISDQSSNDDRFPDGNISNSEFSSTLDQVTATGKPVCCQLVSSKDDSVARLFVEKLSPPKPFWIFGAGDDAIPMAKIADELGWSVTVIDDRAAHLTPERFPVARRLLSSNLAEIQKELIATEETAAVLMTHSFNKDALFLPWLCGASLDYVGLLGPKSRTGKLIQQLHTQDRLPPPCEFNRVKTPVGLDIGATTPAQIAISIAAEIVAIDNGREGGFLSARTLSIHEPVSHQLVESDSSLPVHLEMR